ncbi:MAG: hypothetical protein Q9192_001585 [Flavoplaca navasiana]
MLQSDHIDTTDNEGGESVPVSGADRLLRSTDRESRLTRTPETTTAADPHTRYPLRRRRWFRVSIVIVICSILVALAAWGLNDESSAVILQHITDGMSQAGVQIVTAYLAVHIAVEHGAQKWAANSFAPRNSSRQEIGVGLDEMYTSLAQVLAGSNALYDTPGLVSQKRREAMKFKVSKDSPILEPLERFLNLSSPLDEDLLIVILDTLDVAKLALKEQKHTDKTMRSLRAISRWNWLERVGICLLGTSTQERILYHRLVQHIQILSNAVTHLDEKVRRLLQAFIMLEHVTKDISEASVEEQQRLLLMKQKAAAQFDWLLRAAIQLLALPEPRVMAAISKNIESARDIHEWSRHVVRWLEHMTTQLRYAKLYINRLMEILRKNNTVKWSIDEQEHELEELRAQWANGIEVLRNNTDARLQLQRHGYL